MLKHGDGKFLSRWILLLAMAAGICFDGSVTNYGRIMSLFRKPNRHDTVIKFNASEELKDDLIDLAESRNISLSALLRLVLTEYVRNNK